MSYDLKNVAALFMNQEALRPDQCAVWTPGSQLSFSEMKNLAVGLQTQLRPHRPKPGEAILVLTRLKPELYATILGLLGLGLKIIFVEPWLPVQRIEHILKETQPRFFIHDTAGLFWGLRVPGVRKIRTWLSSRRLLRPQNGVLKTVEVPADHPGFVIFTSGTTGHPKGVVRTHSYLQAQHQILVDRLQWEKDLGPDLCIFANFALLNLASGRTTILIPPAWKNRHLRKAAQLALELQPVTVTCGPEFLKRLVNAGGFAHLREVHVGGAQIDNELFERAFQKWPEAHFTHLYGGSEVEPVSVVDARVAVDKSRAKGYFQTLCVGKPIPEISYNMESDTVWVAGVHVAPFYVGGGEDNQKFKRRDQNNRVWHNMGDRILEQDGDWYYCGRAGVPKSDFLLEQEIYQRLGHSSAFVHRLNNGESVLVYDHAAKDFDWKSIEALVAKKIRVPILRDRRHRARIDRGATLKKGPLWLLRG